MLGDLGSKITGALNLLGKSPVIDEEVLNKVLREIAGALLHADVNVKTVKKLRDNVALRVNLAETPTGANKRNLIHRAVVEELINIMSPDADPFRPERGKCNVVMFVGLQGSGKTTTIAKYANYYRRKGWKVAMVCADTFRAGAFDQLKQNATRVRVPFYGSYTEPDPVRIAEEGVKQFKRERYELIIVDTSGRNKQEAALFHEMQQVRDAVQPDDIVFVMDSTIGQAAVDQATAFKEAVNIGSVIMTKLDSHAKGGGALSAVAATDAPVIFVGLGESFDAFEPFEAKNFVRRLLGMGDVGKLFQELKENGILDEESEMAKRIAGGHFTLRDMYEQFASVAKLGPLNRVLSMIPGLPANLTAGAEGGDRVKSFMGMMDSMTDKELDGLVALNPSRVRRIAYGSGTAIEHVYSLLQAHKQMSKMVSGLSKSKLMKGGDANLGKQISRNPQAVMQQLQKSVPPQLMRQMGGSGALMNLMKQMGDMDPSKMQEMMSGAAGGGAGGGMPPGLAEMMQGMAGGAAPGAAGGRRGKRKVIMKRR